MADPTSGAQIAAGVVGAALGASGLPLPVVLATTLGALIVASNTARVDWSPRAVRAVLTAFALALVLGFAGGQIVLYLAQRALDGPDFPAVAVQVIGSVLCAMYGQRYILPWLLGRMGKTIDGSEQ